MQTEIFPAVRTCNRTTLSERCFGGCLLAASAFLHVLGLGIFCHAESADSLDDALLPLIEAHDGIVAVAVSHPASGSTFAFQADRAMPTASLIKLPVMVAAYAAEHAAELSLVDQVQFTEDDLVPGSRVLDKFSAGVRFSLRDAIRMMMAESDNTATNLVLAELGLARVNDLMDQIGLPGIRIHSPVYRGSESIDADASRQFGLGRGTAAEFLKLIAMIESQELERRGLVSDGASARMLDHMRACEDRAVSPRDLPGRIRVAHKTGFVPGTRTDAGILETAAGPVLFCILTTNNRDRSGPGGEADSLIASLAAEMVAYSTAALPPPSSPLAINAEGELVMDLQRSLNARLPASEAITIDGAFGPNTSAAVKRFQQMVNIPPTGVVDYATWKALSPLAVVATATPASELLKKTAPDEPDGSPTVTAKGWVVMDGRSGELIDGFEPHGVRQPASITKVMTALLVLETVAEDADVSGETVHVSTRAGTETGSSAGLRPGDRVTVGELLYGLLLPSGNDAAVALAEHFGPRLVDSEDSAHDRFVAAMNARAVALGLKATKFGNPHGKTEEGCGSSPRDVADLVRAALSFPAFREIVSSREHIASLENDAGYTRPVVWRNTNRLLGIDGFLGVKTGTTFAAGCCLAACEQRDGRELIVVVLGSSSTEARYCDARNLFRYGWRQLRSRP